MGPVVLLLLLLPVLLFVVTHPKAKLTDDTRPIDTQLTWNTK